MDKLLSNVNGGMRRPRGTRTIAKTIFLQRSFYVLYCRMTDSSDPDDEPGQALVPADEAEAGAVFDAHGHDPSDYKWVPVLRRPRSDGWTPQRQVDFIAALADTGCVAEAARVVGMSVTSCYRLRRQSPQFAAAWDAATAHASGRLVDIAFDRAINGSDEPVFDKEGNRVSRRMRPNDKMLMFLLRAYMPERFRYAHRAVREPHEPEPPAALPLAEALGRLEPEAPAEPHLLMAPGDLDCALEVAELCDGHLPHWHRYRVDPEPEEDSLGEDFERELEAAKREGAGLPPGLNEDERLDEDGDDDPFLA